MEIKSLFHVDYVPVVNEYFRFAPIELLGGPCSVFESLYKNYGIDTVNEFIKHSEYELTDDNPHVAYHYKKMQQRLSEYGLSYRGKEESAFLYGYPEHIKQIAERKDKSWECYLYIDATLYNLEGMKYYRCTDLFKDVMRAYGNNDSENRFCNIRKIDSLDSFSEVMESYIGRYKEYIDCIGPIFNDDLAEGLGRKGEPKDAAKIVEASEKLMAVYRKIVRWKRNLEKISVNDRYRACVEKLIAIADEFYSDMDKYYSKLIAARNKLKDISSGSALDKEVDIALITSSEAVKRFNDSLRNITANKEYEAIYSNLSDETRRLVENEIVLFVSKIVTDVQKQTKEDTVRAIRDKIGELEM